MKKIEDIQYITQDSTQFSHAEQALAMYKKGIKWVQLRMKNKPEVEILDEAQLIMHYAQTYNAQLILNDNVAIAKKVKAHAVHLGLNDMPINKARGILGANTIIGGTANTMEQVLLQTERGADYVGLGPFKHTTTKKNLSPIIGLEGYKQIMQELKSINCNTPLIAVGGIKLNDIDKLRAVGLHGVAISGDLLKSIEV